MEKKKVLITVKAYPNPSKKYSETVCCAGIDLKDNTWIRLYPIPYRDLDSNQKFKKYNIIEIDCSKAKNDKRPESFKVNSDTIQIIKHLDTKKKWIERKQIVLKLPDKSMCQVLKDAKEKDFSLGLIKPEHISFSHKKHTLSDKTARESCYAQLSFFDKAKNAIEEIPYNFYYDFKCSGVSNCPGHKLSIIDWEIGQAYRDWRNRYPTKEILLHKIKQRWLDIADTTKKDVYFYVGNMQRFRNTFMILGVFYPPKNGN